MSRIRFLRDAREFAREKPPHHTPPEELPGEEREEDDRFDLLLNEMGGDAPRQRRRRPPPQPYHPPSLPAERNVWSDLAAAVDVRAATEEEIRGIRGRLEEEGRIGPLESALMIPGEDVRWGIDFLTASDPEGRRDWVEEFARQAQEAAAHGFFKSQEIMTSLLECMHRLETLRRGRADLRI